MIHSWHWLLAATENRAHRQFSVHTQIHLHNGDMNKCQMAQNETHTKIQNKYSSLISIQIQSRKYLNPPWAPISPKSRGSQSMSIPYNGEGLGGTEVQFSEWPLLFLLLLFICGIEVKYYYYVKWQWRKTEYVKNKCGLGLYTVL